MNRILLLLLFPGCAGHPSPVTAPKDNDLPGAEVLDVPRETPVVASLEQEIPLPDSIVIDASVTRGGDGGGPPVTVGFRGGEQVPWRITERTLEPLSFDPSAIAAKPRFVDRWKTSEDEPGAVRICSDMTGMPADALFMELIPADSEVVWEDGSRGTFRTIHSQGLHPIDWELDILTTVPPKNPDIRTIAIALDLHQAKRVRRYEASVAVGQAAAFEFGACGRRWILPEDRKVTEFEVDRHREPNLPLMARGLRSDRMVRLTDSTGAALLVTGIGGAGSVCQRDWSFWSARTFQPPLRVTVDVPLETTTTRIVLRLKDLRPKE